MNVTMVDTTPIMNLISPHWFTDISKSSIWVVGYRMMLVTRKDYFTQLPIIDLGDVRVILYYGSLSYMDASNVFEFGDDHLPNINSYKFENKSTNIGAWTILVTPHLRDGVQRSELETRNSITVAEGILLAFNSLNMVYEKIYENIIELSSMKTTAFAPIFSYSFKPPTIQAPALMLLSQASVNLQALPENVQNRVILSLRWYSKSLQEQGSKEQGGIDSFLSMWIAIEVIGMPNVSDVRPAVQSLADLYQLSYQVSQNRFQLGRIQDFRSKILHDGKMFAIHFLLIGYLEAIYIDLLTKTLNLPHDRRAEKLLSEPGFDLGVFLRKTEI